MKEENEKIRWWNRTITDKSAVMILMLIALTMAIMVINILPTPTQKYTKEPFEDYINITFWNTAEVTADYYIETIEIINNAEAIITQTADNKFTLTATNKSKKIEVQIHTTGYYKHYEEEMSE